MPSVAVCVCQDCGYTDEVVLLDRHMLTTMPPCKCGGRTQVARIFYDRRITPQVPVENGRRAGDASFGSGEDAP